MHRRLIFSVLLWSAFATPALADDNCIAPYAPVLPNGVTATDAQMEATRKEVVTFIKDSDEYQSCLEHYFDQTAENIRADAQKGKKSFSGSGQPDTAATLREAEKIFQDKISRNQKEKERTGNEFNAAVRAHAAASTGPH